MRTSWACLVLSLVYAQNLFGVPAAKLDPYLAQALCEDCISGTITFEVPGYPKAFNPSIISYEGGYLLSFRVKGKLPTNALEKKQRQDASYIGIVEVDRNWNAGSPQLLELITYAPQFSFAAEDARLLKVGDRIFIFFNDIQSLETPKSYAMYFGEIMNMDGKWVLKQPAKLLHYPNAGPIEKNWSPFVAGDNAYVIYSDEPRIILKVNLETGRCTETSIVDSDLLWGWGEIRGGTPAYLVGGMYLTFFHSSIPAKSSKGKTHKGLNYVMGAYAFDKEPPFSILGITQNPLGVINDYLENNDRKVVFPGGFVIDGDYLHVAWGKNDNQICITTFEKQKLLDLMQLQ